MAPWQVSAVRHPGSLFSAYLKAYRGVAGVLQELELGHRQTVPI